ncbi:MAG: U32 family peptidase [Clostridiales bacterium]|nr:U32 family peptidase [Clostridiales bacterium]
MAKNEMYKARSAQMENLAPAGNREALDRAVAAGADAVYLGYAAYSARAGAGNFDEAALREAVHFAHLHHVRVHVTVNTLVKDGELAGVMDVLRLLDEVRVDAVLVQDLGVLKIARTCFPDLPVHASTQMAIHNAAGVRWCRQMGMTRAVLARECSLKEIAGCAGEGIEIEVFGHGAQCVAVSGQCLFSSMIGGRSGNRGRCAQPCRLQYTYRGKTAAWLSPRDVCMRDHLPELAKAGVCSVKLEGRLKRPEYVAAVAGSYRRGIDGLMAGRFEKADAQEKDDLLQIFQRGGFMDGYAMGAQDAGVICEDRVNHGGVPVGRIETVSGGMAKLRLTRALHDGDGLQIRSARSDAEMIYSGHDVPAGEAATLRLRPDMRISRGDEVCRLTSSEQLERARNLQIAPIPCDMTLVALPGEPLTLTATDGISTVTVTGETVTAAQKRAMSEEDARKNLSKTGDTAFELRELTVYTDGAFVPVSALNAIRRDALGALETQRAEAFARPAGRAGACALPVDNELSGKPVPGTIIVRDKAQYSAAKATDARIVWYPEDFREAALEAGLAGMDSGVWLHLPMKCEQATLEMLHRFVTAHADKLGGVVLGSVGQLGMRWPVPFGAGEGVPVMNRIAAQVLLEQGCEFVTASGELSGAELNTLLKHTPCALVPAYGRTQLMLLHHCPARTYLGLSSGHGDCRLCDVRSGDCLEGTAFTDRRNAVFPLLRMRLPEGCLVRLMNSVPTDVVSRVRRAGFTPLMTLSSEAGAALAEAMEVWQGGSSRQETNAGHWNRPVE